MTSDAAIAANERGRALGERGEYAAAWTAERTLGMALRESAPGQSFAACALASPVRSVGAPERLL